VNRAPRRCRRVLLGRRGRRNSTRVPRASCATTNFSQAMLCTCTVPLTKERWATTSVTSSGTGAAAPVTLTGCMCKGACGIVVVVVVVVIIAIMGWNRLRSAVSVRMETEDGRWPSECAEDSDLSSPSLSWERTVLRVVECSAHWVEQDQGTPASL